jgi:hypothetical protein
MSAESFQCLWLWTSYLTLIACDVKLGFLALQWPKKIYSYLSFPRACDFPCMFFCLNKYPSSLPNKQCHRAIESCVSHMIINSTIWQSKLILQCQIGYTKKIFFVNFRFWNKFCMNLCLSFFLDGFKIRVWVFGIHSNPIKPCWHQKLVRKTFRCQLL